MFYYDVLPEKRESYLKMLKDECRKLDQKSRQFVHDFLTVTQEQKEQGYYLREKEMKRVEELEFASLEDVFPCEIHPALDLILGSYHRTLLLDACEKLPRFPHMNGHFRSLDYKVHLEMIWHMFSSLLNESLSEIDSLKLMEESFETNPYSQLTPRFYLFVEIDRKNEKVIDLIKRWMSSEEKNRVWSRELFRAIFCSDNVELVKLTGNLLLSPSLSEGLRQVICETMYTGTWENFLYMFALIEEHKLIRFSSVRRAVAIWSGMGEEYADHLGDREIRMMKRLTEEPEYVDLALKSEDNLELFFALWRKGAQDIDIAIKVMEEILRTDRRGSKLLISYYLQFVQGRGKVSHIVCEVLEQYPQDMEVLACYHDLLFGQENWYYFRTMVENYEREDCSIRDYFKDEAEAEEIFNIYTNFAYEMREKSREFSPCIFPWHRISISKESLVEAMILIGVMLKKENSSFVIPYFKYVQPYVRCQILEILFQTPQNEEEERFILSMMSDRSFVGESARKIAEKNGFVSHYAEEIEEFLRFKSSAVRNDIISILYSQEDVRLKASVERLISSSDEQKRLAALDIALRSKEDGRLREGWLGEKLKMIRKPTSGEKILIRQFFEGRSINQLEEGLYDIHYLPVLDMEVREKEIERNSRYHPKLLGKKKKGKYIISNSVSVSEVFCKKPEELFNILKKWIDLYEAHKDHEYETDEGERVFLHDMFVRMYPKDDYRAPDRLEDYPLSELWREFYYEHISDFQTLYQLQALIQTNHVWYIQRYYHYKSVANRMLGYDVFELKESLKKYTQEKGYDSGRVYLWLNTMIDLLVIEYRDEYRKERFEWAKAILSYLWLHEEPGDLLRESDYEWRDEGNSYSILREFPLFITAFNDLMMPYVSEEQFVQSYLLSYNLHKKLSDFAAKRKSPLRETWIGITDVAGAVQLGLVEKDELYRFVLRSPSISNEIGFISDCLDEQWMKNNIQNEEEQPYYSLIREEGSKMIEFIVESEMERGESPLETSCAVHSIRRVEGIKHAVRVLKALGSEKFDRETYFGRGGDSKKATLSRILKVSHPKKEETVSDLKRMLQDSEISEKRLVETAMYSPQWIPLIEEYLGWNDMESGYYFIQAHAGVISEEEAGRIAEYTPISVVSFKEGAFDTEWFKSVYRQMGRERFDLLYKSAKNISDAAKYSRTKMFFDAVNGEIKRKECEKKIREDRDRDAVASYGLLPLSKNRKTDMVHRYRFLQTFLEESPNFRKQRQLREEKAVEVSLENLSRNAGYSDVMRLICVVEADLFPEEINLFPKGVIDVEPDVEIHGSGHPYFPCRADVKGLQHQKKDGSEEETSDIYRKMREQYERCRKTLEEAMEDGSEFSRREMDELMKHPLTSSILRQLILRSGEDFGYFSRGSLKSFDGSEIEVSEKRVFVIAHPMDLYESGQLENYRKDLLAGDRKQAFKQVFRKLYRKTEEEREKDVCLRYFGFRVRVNRMMEILKERRWVVDGEEGLQKVYYRQNLIAKIRAYADWYSLTDEASTTLEEVRFFDRKTLRALNPYEVSDRVFSEVIRDIESVIDHMDREEETFGS